MAIQVALHHVTDYRYDRLVNLSPQVVRLRPAPHCRTPVVSYSLSISPDPHFINWQQDPFANYLARLVFPERTRHLRLTVDLVAKMAVYNPFDFFLEKSAEQFPFRYDPDLSEELAPYLVTLGALTGQPQLKRFLADVDLKARHTIDFLVDLNRLVQNRVRYLIRLEPGVQTPEETLELACGSCRDSAWLLVQALRHCGLAARFVSGYLIQLVPDVKALDGPSGPAQDFTDLHAWCEVYLPGAGWIGLDPTSGLLAGEGHIPLAATPKPGSAAPITGGVDECEVEFHHDMKVTRLVETPRVTKPYTEAAWSRILALGDAVDADLERQDVRLTQGGEPTFVAVVDRDAAEWNTDALGPTKRGFATELLHKLAAHYATGGFLHCGQGKWYPGEQLPRWALAAYWRRDKVPIWNHPERFADERVAGHYAVPDAEAFIRALATRLALEHRFILPAYEDTFYYLWRERRLPSNVDPFDSRLEDEMERARLRHVFMHGLSEAVGYVLPLAPDDDGRWQSGPWFLRDERLYLMPGDSPLGYRLPLDSLPWATEADRVMPAERDPFAPRPPLATTTWVFQAPGRSASAGGPDSGSGDAASADSGRKGASGTGTQGPGAPDGPGAVRGTDGVARGAFGEDLSADPARSPLARFKSAGGVTRTALCVETRGGILYVFMPPLALVEDYLALLAAVEATALERDVQLVIEGYAPPRDPRLVHFQVTPDPGVIEVNIHPAANWKDLVEHTEFLYQAAFETHLGAEKFMIDGRHTGTGGGNHMVLGGATAADSPFLRRPDLLASLVSYWHNHPALSYLFSGLFIGPTSQAPRVDEARGDSVYELEVALAEVRRTLQAETPPPPWFIDRALRNILIDVTGNTHRAEFCIDKLYTPEGGAGRLGLLELRAFEMPPHARMSLVQQLFLRALVARFWRAPYQARLARWGTTLHDRFLLPTFVQSDLEDVLADLATHGYAFDPAWFAPHFEFRFPVVGELASRGLKLTLRAALEPWHVLGEESSAGGTVRYVDASLERLEIKVQGLNNERHVVTVNRRPLPLHPTGRAGEFVAGVRYKAWEMPSALHPSIAAHAPLVIDIVDTWNQRSIGGCQYHVAHPGGRNYDTFPVNAYEAESRRLARFFNMGHTPGRLQVDVPVKSLEYPFTLDLRRP